MVGGDPTGRSRKNETVGNLTISGGVNEHPRSKDERPSILGSDAQ